MAITCDGIRAERAKFLKERDDTQKEIDRLTRQGASDDQLEPLFAKRDALDSQISDLENQFASQCIVLQPQSILEIQFSNPAHPTDFDALQAQTIAFGKPDPTPLIGGEFPSIDACVPSFTAG